MKGSHSRLSHRSDRRYSNVAHIQGGMITDADLTEAGQLHQARDEAQGRVFAGSGIPVDDGMVVLDGDDLVFRSGTALAEGKLGRFELRDGLEKARLKDAMANQVDLPDAPDPHNEALVYLDVWDRPVFAAQDPYLADPGLHGAETAYRTRTMVQLKTFPMKATSTDAEIAAALRREAAFRRTGNASLRVLPLNTVIEPVDCDPCADQISINREPPNALFRVEVVAVHRSGPKGIKAIELAWSFENAEAIEVSELAASLDRGAHVYEKFTDTTEAHIGYFHHDRPPTRPKFEDTVKDEDAASSGFTHVRRWDGHATINLDRGVSFDGLSKSQLSPKGNLVILRTQFFEVELTLMERDILAGDYWLVELRRNAPEDEQIRVHGGPANEPHPPRGPEHHFCPLFLTRGDVPVPLSDAMVRRLSMPSLSDIPARNVDYDAPDCDLLAGSEHVQEALDRLCDLDATHVGFESSDPDCETLAEADTVQDALMKLCEADKRSQNELMLRTMMDWGVVAGIKVLRDGNTLAISGGVALDRNGVLHEVAGEVVKMASFGEKNVLPRGLDLAEVQEKWGEICLALAFNGNRQTLVLTDPISAMDLDDMSLKEQIENCLEGKSTLAQAATIKEISSKNDPQILGILTKIHIAHRYGFGRVQHLGLDNGERAVAQQILKGLIDDMHKRGMTADVESRLDLVLNSIAKESERNTLDLSPSQENLRFIALSYAAILNFDEEYRIRCVCDNLVPPMPDKIEGWTLVPIAGLELSSFTFGGLALDRVCMTTCRKQSHNWRSFNYYYGQGIPRIFEAFDDLCCDDKLRAEGNVSGTLTNWHKSRGAAPWDGAMHSTSWPVTPTHEPRAPQGGNLNAGNVAAMGGWKRKANPDIAFIQNQKVEAAKKTLTDRGFVVETNVPVDKMDAFFAKTKGTPPLLNRRPQRGDTVILITDPKGLVAIDFVVTKQAKQVFRPPFTIFRPIPGIFNPAILNALRGTPAKTPPRRSNPTKPTRANPNRNMTLGVQPAVMEHLVIGNKVVKDPVRARPGRDSLVMGNKVAKDVALNPVVMEALKPAVFMKMKVETPPEAPAAKKTPAKKPAAQRATAKRTAAKPAAKPVAKPAATAKAKTATAKAGPAVRAKPAAKPKPAAQPKPAAKAKPAPKATAKAKLKAEGQAAAKKAANRLAKNLLKRKNPGK